MHILNLEDNVFKHHDICKAIERGSFANLKIECVGNLTDGINKIEDAIKQDNPYDLVISDMWYPEAPGESEKKCGEALINIFRERDWDIPIILCSSVNYRFPEILGSVYYSENEDWESELVKLIRMI
ncbi:MAG: response regulator [Acetatifactor sp.]|nr:response regulator [Acetatifactor sp.]